MPLRTWSSVGKQPWLQWCVTSRAKTIRKVASSYRNHAWYRLDGVPAGAGHRLAVVLCPMLPPPSSVNHRLPSPPPVMPEGANPDVARRLPADGQRLAIREWPAGCPEDDGGDVVRHDGAAFGRGKALQRPRTS